MNRLETFLSVLLQPFQRFENTCIQLLTQRTIDTAIGVQLDVLGKIVGQSRQGQTDDVYRRFIRARVAVNRSTGKHEELLHIANLVLNNSATNIVIMQYQAIATIFVRIDGITVDADTEAALIQLLGDSVAVGVRIMVQSSQVLDASTFMFDNTITPIGTGLGFDNTASPGTGGQLSDVRSN